MVKKNSLMLTAVMIFSLIALQVVPAIACLCEAGANTGSAISEDPAGSCCFTGGGGPEPSGEEFFSGIGKGSSWDDSPVCCCAGETRKQSAIPEAVISVESRHQVNEFRYHEAGTTAFMPDLHLARTQSGFMFQKNMIPTPPHIASTILLI
ncbi:MAG: hypothetical protein FP816_04400 [Desulfobacteraceae bacterium]|nr:hypothetical protein [Desulfobacteraceae bacterium]